jgi:hypothetical protein
MMMMLESPVLLLLLLQELGQHAAPGDSAVGQTRLMLLHMRQQPALADVPTLLLQLLLLLLYLQLLHQLLHQLQLLACRRWHLGGSWTL